MSKRAEDLAFKYNIRGGVDELSIFVSEVYNDGYHAGKAFKERMNVRDKFASMAMQGLIANGWDPEAIAEYAYIQADAMLKAREKEEEIQELLAQPEQFKPDWASYRQEVEDAKHGIGVDDE